MKKGKLKQKKLPSVLTREEIDKIFSVLDRVRDVLLLKTLYYTGLRVNELIQIRRKDINFRENVIRIRAEITKTRQEALQPLPKKLINLLEEWCKNFKEEDILFPITKQRVWQIVKKTCEKAKITKNIHPHTFRHSYATHIYEETNDLGKVQELLRHKSLSSTGIYKHLSQKLKKKTVDEVFK